MDGPADQSGEVAAAGRPVRRHRLSTRLWHWINAATLAIMLMSGLMIFNAHPRLYWGQYGANFDAAWLEIGHRGDAGMVRIGGLVLHTSGLFGTSRDALGVVHAVAFPGWLTIPSTYSLADARLWHLAFAWVLAASFVVNGLMLLEVASCESEAAA